MIRTRMAFETPKSGTSRVHIKDFIKSIYNESASSIKILNFYRGFFLSVVGMVPYGGVSFLAHNYFGTVARTKFAQYTINNQPPSQSKTINSSHRKPKKKLVLRAWAELTIGGLSGICAQTFSYPFELVRRQLQVSGTYSPNNSVKVSTIVKNIYSSLGMKGFFLGLSIGYIKVLPMFAISFYTYEKLKELFDLD
ncbi:Mitochondrial carrier protein LEU5 [Smittium culicis]|uniref:Mitochondrial carrier protein LEU5 n=1 Tax=Smittium culicis TaxID=133412 RepID=A0A1R1XRK6_9FUNG|nr:Mitochondrial carrier protein LEU5 [Smittium culicis]OMJ23782.1 Mitochondrial carrier protein LEU5 [Smittium culicis]